IPSRDELEAVAQRAGALALARFRGVAAERKAGRTLVTEAGREGGRDLVDTLVARVPGVGGLGGGGGGRGGRGGGGGLTGPAGGGAGAPAVGSRGRRLSAGGCRSGPSASAFSGGRTR